MLQEEIARLTGTLKFNVEARPLVAFEKRLMGVMNLLREFSTIANKKFTVKVALDSRSLRAQIDKATKAKISLTNIDISNEVLSAQGKRIQEYLDKTPIRLSNVKVDISKLVEQKKFVKTLMGQMQIDIPIKFGFTAMETELRREMKAIGARNPLKVHVEISQTQMILKLRRAILNAQKNIGSLKLRVVDPEVRLKVDKQHLIAEIRSAIQNETFDIRIGARRTGGSGGGLRAEGSARSRGQVHKGISAMEGFARAALPGLGAAMAFDKMNDINQKVTAAQNSLEAVSGNEANFKSNRNFLTNMTHEMGLNFRDVAPQFSSIFQSAAPKIGVGATQDMFRGIMQYGTVHGLDKEAMKGSMVALSQMFGKDKIQSEEARQQFSERMPNGMAMLAEAAFKSKQIKTNSVAAFGDLMKAGKADPAKILPELGRLMKEASERNDAYKKSLDTTRVAQGRMNTAFEDSVVIFAKGGFDKGMGGFFNKMSDAMQRAKPLIEALGGAFEILIKPLNAVITLIGDLGEAWPKIAKAFGISEKALAAFATGIALFMLPFGGFIAALAAAALVVEDFVTYFKGGDSVFGTLVKDTPGAQAAVDGISKAFQGVVNLMDKWLEKSGLLTDGIGSIKFSDVFLASLETVKSVLEETLRLMTAIDQLMNGDTKGAGKSLSDFAAKNSIYNQVYNRLDHSDSPTEGDTGPGFWGGLGDWLTGPASKRQTLAQRLMGGNDAMPPTYSGTVDRSGVGSAGVTTGPLTLNLTVQAPDGVTDPVQFASSIAPHFETMMEDYTKKVFGAARAQQAERQ